MGLKQSPVDQIRSSQLSLSILLKSARKGNMIDVELTRKSKKKTIAKDVYLSSCELSWEGRQFGILFSNLFKRLSSSCSERWFVFTGFWDLSSMFVIFVYKNWCGDRWTVQGVVARRRTTAALSGDHGVGSYHVHAVGSSELRGGRCHGLLATYQAGRPSGLQTGHAGVSHYIVAYCSGHLVIWYPSFC